MNNEFIAEIINDVVSGLSSLQCAISNHRHGLDTMAKQNIDAVEKVLKRLSDKAELLLVNVNENGSESNQQGAENGSNADVGGSTPDA